MMKQGSNRGFSLVSLLLVVAIIAALSVVAYVGMQKARVNVMNERVAADLLGIQNALEAYKDGKGSDDKYPLPYVNADKNLNCYNIDTSYNHECTEASGAAFVQSQIDNNLLTKKYLQEVPTDPRTGARYAYGVTTDGQYYQVAGLIENPDGSYEAKVVSNLHFTYPLKSLIRAYNGPNFVMDGEGYLPYSYDYLVITATLGYIPDPQLVTINGNPAITASEAKAGDVIKNDSPNPVVIYFSDGSVTYLDPNSELRILVNTLVEKNDKDGIITKIRLKLLQGKVWNKVARLAAESEFNIETTSAIAGVRGTEFGIDEGSALVVLTGDVAARQIDSTIDDFDSEGNVIFDKSDSYFGNNEVVTGTGTLAGFEAGLPGAGASASASAPDPIDYEKYYQQPYSNNLEPRLHEIKAPVPPEPPVISFEPFEESSANSYDLLPLTKIHVYDSDANSELITWDHAAFEIDPADGIIKVNETIAQDFFANFQGRNIIFIFEDSAESLSAPSTPPILIQDNTYLSWDMLYGDDIIATSTGGQGGGGGGGGQAPTITTIPSYVGLGEEATLISDANCDWTITGGGALVGPTTNVQDVLYESIDTTLNVNQKITDIGGRFGNAADNTITVVCSNSSGSDTKAFVVGYAPWANSSLTGYEYSWHAAGSTNWFDATVECQNLTEGGPGNNWKLPENAIFEPLSSTQREAESAHWCGTWNSPSCTSLPDGVATIWLAEEDPGQPSDAYILQGWNLGVISAQDKNSNESYRGFRCVK